MNRRRRQELKAQKNRRIWSRMTPKVAADLWPWRVWCWAPCILVLQIWVHLAGRCSYIHHDSCFQPRSLLIASIFPAEATRRRSRFVTVAAVMESFFLRFIFLLSHEIHFELLFFSLLYLRNIPHDLIPSQQATPPILTLSGGWNNKMKILKVTLYNRLSPLWAIFRQWQDIYKIFLFTRLNTLFRKSFPKGLRERERHLTASKSRNISIKRGILWCYFHQLDQIWLEPRCAHEQRAAELSNAALDVGAESGSVVLITHAAASCRTLINEEIIESIILNSTQTFTVKEKETVNWWTWPAFPW